MSDSDEYDPSWMLEQSEHPPLSAAWPIQSPVPAPPANKRDRKASKPANHGPSTVSSSASSLTASKPHPFAQYSRGNDFLVYSPPSATLGASSSEGVDLDPSVSLSATSNPSGKRSLDESDSTLAVMTIAPSDSPQLPASSHSFQSHDVTFRHSPGTVNRLRAEGLPDFLIRHYALLTVTIRSPGLPSQFHLLPLCRLWLDLQGAQ